MELPIYYVDTAGFQNLSCYINATTTSGDYYSYVTTPTTSNNNNNFNNNNNVNQLICCINTATNINNCSISSIITSTSSIIDNDDDDINNNGTHPPIEALRHSAHMIIILSVMYSVTFLSALMGNAAIVSMVIKDRRFHSATYILIMNLAIADLIMTLVCHPINLVVSLYTSWLFGAFLCKAVPFLQGVAVCSSVNTLVVIAVDRYIAICHVMRPRNTKCITRIILVVIWVLAIALMSPWAYYYKLDHAIIGESKIEYCYEAFPEPQHEKMYFLGVIFLTCYALPLLFIVVCYVLIGYRVWHRDAPGITSSKGVIEKSKIRVVKMLVVVVLLFTFSWLPMYILRLKSLFAPPPTEHMYMINTYLVPFAQWLGTSNSCMNPLVYCLFSQKIRRRIKAMICCRKQESRTLYSNKSVYSSVVQHNLRRDSTLGRETTIVNGGGVGGGGGGGSMMAGFAQHQQQHHHLHHHHPHHPRMTTASVYEHRNLVKSAGGRLDQNELLTFHTRNGVKSTHV